MKRREWLAAALACAVAGARSVAAAEPWRFGLTPVMLDDRLTLLRRWKAYLDGVVGGDVEFAQRSNYAQIVDGLRGGVVDFAWICGYPYVQHADEFRLVAVPVWRGRPLYQSYLIGAAESKASGLEDLRGKVFAFSDPLSNSGYLYVRYTLARAGLQPSDFFRRTFFTYSHRHVVTAVAEGLADAGSVDGYVWETLAEVLPGLTRRTRVIARSGDFGFPPIVAAPHVGPAAFAAVRGALLQMDKDAAGKQVLAELRLDGFAPGSPALFESIAAMARAVA